MHALIALATYGVMVQMLGEPITLLHLAIYCHTEYEEKVIIRKINELRTKIKNEPAMMNETEGDPGETYFRQ
jgi:hypothetical protein